MSLRQIVAYLPNLLKSPKFSTLRSKKIPAWLFAGICYSICYQITEQ